MKTLFFLFCPLVFISSLFFQCSSADVPQIVDSKVTPGESLTAKEFIQIVERSCTEQELAFLKSLPDSTKLVILPDSMRLSVKSYQDYSMVKSVITTPLSLSFKPIYGDTNAIVLTNSKSISTRSSTQIMAITMDVAYLSSNLIGHVSSSLRGTFMYEYDTEEHIIISCPVPPTIDIANRPGSIDSHCLVWRDLGSFMTPGRDRISFLYGINGDVILGVSISSYPVGFVCEQFRGRTGEFLVPY